MTVAHEGDESGFWRHPTGMPLIACAQHREGAHPLRVCQPWPRSPCEVCDLLAFGGRDLVTHEQRRAFEREFFAVMRDKAVHTLGQTADVIGVVWIDDQGLLSSSDALVDACAVTLERWASGIAGTLQGIVRTDNQVSGRGQDSAAARLFALAVGKALRDRLERGLRRPDTPFAPPARVALVMGVHRGSHEIVCSLYPRAREPEVWALALYKVMRAIVSQLDGAATLTALLRHMDLLIRGLISSPQDDSQVESQSGTCGQRPAGIAYDPEQGGTPIYCELLAGHTGDHRSGTCGWHTSALDQ